MSQGSAASAPGEKTLVVIEYEKVEGTYLELGYWDDDIGAERYAELLHEGRIREEGYLTFDGNLLLINGQPDTAISLKNETIFRCYCAPDLQNCRACFMRKRTIFAEGSAQLARVELHSTQATVRDLRAENGILGAENAALRASTRAIRTELRTSKAQVLALKDYIAKELTGRVAALGPDHPLNVFHRAADQFESEGGNVGLSARLAVSGLQGGVAPTPDNGRRVSHDSGFGGGVPSGSPPDSAGESTYSDDEDAHDGLARARKRRRVSSAGPSRPPTSATTSSSTRRRRRRPSSASGARRQLPLVAEAALAVPASSGPEMPVEVPASAPASASASASAPALAVPASSGPEKPAGRSSWNSRSALFPVAAPAPAPAVPTSSAAAASGPLDAAGPSSAPVSPSRKRKSPSPPADTDTDTDADADIDTSSSSSDSDSDSSAGSPATQTRTTHTRNNTWTEREKDALVDVMTAYAAGVAAGTRPEVFDVALWGMVQAELRTEHGVDRKAQACRMTWGRGLRERTGIDERSRKDPKRLATSVQKKAGQ